MGASHGTHVQHSCSLVSHALWIEASVEDTQRKTPRASICNTALAYLVRICAGFGTIQAREVAGHMQEPAHSKAPVLHAACGSVVCAVWAGLQPFPAVHPQLGIVLLSLPLSTRRLRGPLLAGMGVNLVLHFATAVYNGRKLCSPLLLLLLLLLMMMMMMLMLMLCTCYGMQLCHQLLPAAGWPVAAQHNSCAMTV